MKATCFDGIFQLNAVLDGLKYTKACIFALNNVSYWGIFAHLNMFIIKLIILLLFMGIPWEFHANSSN